MMNNRLNVEKVRKGREGKGERERLEGVKQWQ